MKGAVHFAAAESLWPSDRAMHMALGCQVQYQVGIGLPHRRRCGLGVGKIPGVASGDFQPPDQPSSAPAQRWLDRWRNRTCRG